MIDTGVLGYRARREGVKPRYTIKARTKAWVKTALNRLNRRTAIAPETELIPTEETMPQIVTDHTFPVERATERNGQVIASTGWQSFKDSVTHEFLTNLEASFKAFPECRRYAYMARVEANIKMDHNLKALAKSAIPYAYGEIKNALERSAK
jgi:hypothetical protein